MFRKKDLIILESVVMLRAVKENFGKRKAAQNLCVSIDTLNRYLNNLEIELGSKLVFIKNNRALLTRQGENIIKISEQIESCLQKIYDIRLKDRENNIIHIVYDRNIYLPQMSLVCKIYPQITFYFDFWEDSVVENNKAYDICLCYSVPKNEDVEVIYKKEFDCGFFASEEYLRKHKGPDSYENLLKCHKLILKQSYLDQICDVCFKERRIQLVSNSSFVITEALKANSGIGIMPLFKKEYEKLVWLENIFCPIKEKIYLVARNSVSKTPYGRLILEYYIKFLEKL